MCGVILWNDDGPYAVCVSTRGYPHDHDSCARRPISNAEKTYARQAYAYDPESPYPVSLRDLNDPLEWVCMFCQKMTLWEKVYFNDGVFRRCTCCGMSKGKWPEYKWWTEHWPGRVRPLNEYYVLSRQAISELFPNVILPDQWT